MSKHSRRIRIGSLVRWLDSRISVLVISLIGALSAGLAFAPTPAAPDVQPAMVLQAGSAAPAILPAYASARVDSGFAQLPIRFEPNVGQARAPIKYLAHGAGYSVGLTRQGAILGLAMGKAADPEQPDGQRNSRAARLEKAFVRISPVGVKSQPVMEPEQPQGSYSNYFIGNDPAKWRSNVANYGAVRYEQVYPGIDWVVYGNPKQLEYDLVVAPRADARQIKLRVEGGDSLAIDSGGNLLVRVHGQLLRQDRPVAYQRGPGGERQTVDTHYLLDGEQLAFALGSYDRSRPLIIDPVLSFATYLGGTGADGANCIATSSAGEVYLAGVTGSDDFPTASPLQRRNRAAAQSGDNAFVAKLNAAGTALLYSTYLGGSVIDAAYGIAVDRTGAAYVAGNTASPDFPTVNAYQSTNKGSATGFVTKLAPAGNALVYSTYLGGSVSDIAQAIAVDGRGHAYVAGSTESADFPVANAFQSSFQGAGPSSPSTQDAFVTEFDVTGRNLLYSTFLGGGADRSHCQECDVYGASAAFGIAVDAAGSAYVVGMTNSIYFPLLKPFQPLILGVSDNNSYIPNAAFLTKLKPGGRPLAYSTFLGGSYSDLASAVAVDASGDAYVTGFTQSTRFPTLHAIQPAFAGTAGGYDYNAFVTEFDPSGGSLVYSTYLGGSNGTNGGTGIAVDSAGNAYVVGNTAATDFPTVEPIQATSGGGNDAFIAEIQSGGGALVFSSYFGGRSVETAGGVAVDGSGNIYVAGTTDSTDFPAINAIQSANAGSSDAFVAKIEVGTGIAAGGDRSHRNP